MARLLSIERPDLAKQIHPSMNKDVDVASLTIGSRTEIWWIYPYDDPELEKHFDFVWKDSVKNRIQRDKCPYIYGQKVWEGFNDLQFRNPDLSLQWNAEKNGIGANAVSYKSGIEYWWKYPYDDEKTGKHFVFEWKASIATRMHSPQCPFLLNVRVWKGYNDLATTHPEVAALWHPTRNGEKMPCDYVAGSGVKVWWFLKYYDSRKNQYFDFEWERSILEQTNKGGCPYLAKYNPRIWVGFNDFASYDAELAKQWNYKKNGTLKPEQVTFSSGQNVWWIYPYDDAETGKHFDFEWKAVIANRNANRECPFLVGRRVWPGYNDLASKFPEVAAQWHPTKNGHLTPDQIHFGSNQNAWWLYPYDDPETGKHFDFEWEAQIASRTRMGLGCPFLSNARVWKGYNDIETTDPELAKQWHITKNGDKRPDQYTIGSSEKVWWHCSQCGQDWKAAIYSRKHNGCPNCAIEMNTSFPEAAIFYYVSKVFGDTRWRDTEYGKELDIFIPSKKVAIEYDGRHWHKGKKQEDLQKNEFCSRHGINLYRFREMLDSLNDSSIDILLCDAKKKTLQKAIEQLFEYLRVDIQCIDINFERDEVDILNLYVNGKKNASLQKVDPELATQWHPILNGNITPDMVLANSSKRVWWFMPYYDERSGKTFNFEWQETIKNRRKGNGCPYLAGKKVWKGFNDLETWYPELAAQWHPTLNGNLQPCDVTHASNAEVWWIYLYTDPQTGKEIVFEWPASIHNRTTNPQCPYLTGKRVLSGFNDFATLYPEICKEWVREQKTDFTPEKSSAHSNRKVLWRCAKCGTEYWASYNSRANGSGCKVCYHNSRRKK